MKLSRNIENVKIVVVLSIRTTHTERAVGQDDGSERNRQYAV